VSVRFFEGYVAALILTYHAVEAGPAPLCAAPATFEAHADVIARSGLPVVTVCELAERMAVTPDQDVVAITFDDGFASAAEIAAPMLHERGLVATFFCVAGHLGATNDWSSARSESYRSTLADAKALSRLAAAGFEIGSHGTAHAPLVDAPEGVLVEEIEVSRRSLEQALRVPVTSFAYPYGAVPGPSARDLVAATYDAACTTSLGRARNGADLHTLPRVDAHYVRSPDLLERALAGRLDGYLRVRGLAARTRRAIVKDYGARTPVASAQGA
jgi:peptidoglycan/xylan/chitin deacetylase (PgdA/CDA1 family)